jgi:hypothetical protein
MRAKNASVLVSPKRSDNRGISCIQTRVKLLKQLASKLACCLALKTQPGIKSLEPRQRLLNDLTQFLAGQRAVLCRLRSCAILASGGFACSQTIPPKGLRRGNPCRPTDTGWRARAIEHKL